MTPKSQTLKEVLDEPKNRFKELDRIVIHANLPGEMFSKAPVLDPEIYKGGPRASRGYDQKYDPSTLRKMEKTSDHLDDKIAEGMVDAQKKSPGSYDKSFAGYARRYFSGEGKELDSYLREQGRDIAEIAMIAVADLGSATAGLAFQNGKAALYGDKNFEKKVANIAQRYHVTPDIARRYVFDHEHVHASQNGKYANNHFAAEHDVENTLREFYSQMAEKNPAYAKEYKALKGIAEDRSASVWKNYSSLGSNAPAYAENKAPAYAGSKASYNGKAAA